MSSPAHAFAAACAAGFTAGWCATNVGAIPSEIASAYGIGLAAVGLFTTALFLTHMATQIPGGKLSDRFGARRVSVLGMAVLAGANAIALIAPDPALGLGARLLAGVGMGLGWIAATAYLRATGGSAFLLGLFGGIALAGGGVALAVVPQLEPALSWRASYWTALVVTLASLLLLALAPADTEHLSRPRGAGARAGILRDPRLLRLAALFSVSYGLSLVVANWVVEILVRHGGLDNATAGLVGAAILLAGLVSRPLGGWALGRRPEWTRAALGLCLVGGAASTVAILIAEPLWLAALGCAMLGVAAGVPFAPLFMGASATRPDAPGAAVGLVSGANALTVLVATPLLGLTFSLPGDGQIGFAIVAALWIAALWLLRSGRALEATGS